MQKLFFLSGVNRAGCTVLGSLINQNPDFHVTTSSPLMDIVVNLDQYITHLRSVYTFDHNQKIHNFITSAYETYFKDIDKKYVIDNHRGWANNILQIKKDYDPDPRIICTYRPIPEVITSFITLMNADPTNAIDQQLKKENRPINIKNRAMLVWEATTRTTWEALHNGLTIAPQHIHLVNYHDLCARPAEILEGIYNFLGVPAYNGHDFENIENTLAEDRDEMRGFKNLHTIRPTLQKISKDPRQVLGDELFNYFSKFDQKLRIPK